jgi:hypothetical protein
MRSAGNPSRMISVVIAIWCHYSRTTMNAAGATAVVHRRVRPPCFVPDLGLFVCLFWAHSNVMPLRSLCKKMLDVIASVAAHFLCAGDITTANTNHHHHATQPCAYTRRKHHHHHQPISSSLSLLSITLTPPQPPTSHPPLVHLALTPPLPPPPSSPSITLV